MSDKIGGWIAQRRAIQRKIAGNINRRGYGKNGLGDIPYIAKQLAIALQELREALKLFDLPVDGLPPAVAELLTPAAKAELKAWFHDVGYWQRVKMSPGNRPELDEEIADTAIPLLNAAEQVLAVDLLALCAYKSERDVERGVTG